MGISHCFRTKRNIWNTNCWWCWCESTCLSLRSLKFSNVFSFFALSFIIQKGSGLSANDKEIPSKHYATLDAKEKVTLTNNGDEQVEVLLLQGKVTFCFSFFAQTNINFVPMTAHRRTSGATRTIRDEHSRWNSTSISRLSSDAVRRVAVAPGRHDLSSRERSFCVVIW